MSISYSGILGILHPQVLPCTLLRQRPCHVNKQHMLAFRVWGRLMRKPRILAPKAHSLAGGIFLLAESNLL